MMANLDFTRREAQNGRIKIQQINQSINLSVTFIDHLPSESLLGGDLKDSNIDLKAIKSLKTQ